MTFSCDRKRSQGRLLSVTARNKSDSSPAYKIRYTYDYLGRKIGRTVERFYADQSGSYVDSSVAYIYDGSELLAELNLLQGGKISWHYFNGPSVNEVLGVTHSTSAGNGDNEEVWFFADPLGTVRSLGYRDSEGDWLIQHRHYSPFGKLIKTDGSDYGLLSASSHIWAGHHQDLTTGLYYMQARWMDPDSGRFMSQDPMGFAAGDTNLYRYAGNSPTNFVDPTGMIAESTWDVISLEIGMTSLIASFERGDELGIAIDSAGIVLDSVALLVPGLPGGAGAVIKATRGMQGVKNNIQALQSFKRGAQATARLARWSDIGIHGASGYHAYQNDSWLGMGLSAFGVSIRGVQGVGAARNFLTHHPRWNPANWVHRIPHQQGQGRVYAGSLGGGLQQWCDSLWFGYVPPGWVRRPSGVIVPEHLANLPAPTIQVGRTIPGQPGVVTGGSSTKLGKNMMEAMGLGRSQTWKGYQAQHVIPSEVRSHPVIQKIGMDLDHASNGKFLKVPKEGTTSVMSRHRGYHSVYNEVVDRALNRMDVSKSVVNLQHGVADLQRKLRYLQDQGVPLYPSQGATVELWERLLREL